MMCGYKWENIYSNIKQFLKNKAIHYKFMKKEIIQGFVKSD